MKPPARLTTRIVAKAELACMFIVAVLMARMTLWFEWENRALLLATAGFYSIGITLTFVHEHLEREAWR